MPDNQDETAFTFPVNVRTLPRKGRHLKYSADEAARAKIAAAYDLEAVTSFEATCHISPWKRDGVKMEGRVKAAIVQPCAVTSEPLDNRVDEDVDMIFVPEGSKLARPRTNDEGEWVFDVEGDDLPDTFTGDSIDLAEVWLEFFAMGIDPFARKDGVDFAEGVGAKFAPDANLVESESPFAALAGLKTQNKDG